MKSPELDAVRAIIQAVSPLEIQIRRQVLDTANLIIESMEKLVNSAQRKPKNPPTEAVALSGDEPNKLFSTNEAAKMFGVSRATILNWHQDGHIAGIPKGKDNRSGLLFKKSVLVAFSKIHKKHSKLAKKPGNSQKVKKAVRKAVAQKTRKADVPHVGILSSKASGTNGVARA